ncbi:MAG: cytochrome C [Deltaproteobacteria bacterium]|nr:MAG: cytochrome C [Deltaproteobacteria bacterium]
MLQKFLDLFLCAIIAATFPTASAASSLDAVGRTLFESTTLGKSGRSCSTCHPGGRGLEQVDDFTDDELKDIINACIRDALHGSKLAENAEELRALVAYVRSLKR